MNYNLLNLNLRPNFLRIIFGTFALYLLLIVLFNFYYYGSVPTDENWYSSTPSKFYVIKSFPAIKIERSRDLSKSVEHTLDSIRVGNLILAINDNWVVKQGNIDHFYETIPDQPVVKLTIFPLEFRKAAFEYLVDKSALPDSFVRILPPTAHVFDVIEGGASDRAGMQVGDLILRINGKNFNSIWEADAIMKSARAGKTIDYDVIRDNEVVTLHVTLAQFGFDTSVLMPFISGLIIMFVSIFIGLRSPHLKAGRLLGSALLAFGFYIAVGFSNKELISQNEFFSILRQFTIYLCFGFGVAWWLDSTYFFPKQWSEILKYRWVRIVPYAFAGLFIITAIVLYLTGYKFAKYLNILIISALVYNLIIHVIFRQQRPIELKKLIRVVARTIYIGYFLIFILIFFLEFYKLPKLMNYTEVLTLLIPIAYLFTIGRYRLLDINLQIRKNIQYSILSGIWAVSLLAVFVFILIKLLSLNFNIPRFRLTLTSFELLEGQLAAPKREIVEKSIVTIGTIVFGLMFWKVRQWGQKLIDRKYYRTQFNYQHFSREIAEVMATKLGIAELARGIVSKLTESMKLKRTAILFFRDDKTYCYQAAYGFNGLESEEFFMDIDHKLLKFITDFKTDSRLSVDYLPGAVQKYLSENGFRHIIPIWFKDKLSGILLIGEKLSETPLHTEDLSFFTTVAKQASVSIENAYLYEQLAEKERLKHELEIAREIQLASLPQTTPKIKGMDIAGISIPAAEVGGDYFDYLNGVSDTMTVIVGDVSGKGTSAALYLFKIQGILRSLYGFGLTPRELFIRANQLLYRDLEKKSFVTAIGGYFDPNKNLLILARAGHLPLFYYYAKANKVEKITPKGLGLGLDEQILFSSEIEEKSFNYNKNDVFVFITDGITEAQSKDGKEFGEDNLIKVLEENHFHSAKKIRDQIISEVARFSVDTLQHDDQTVVVVKAI